jgi:hypothetical protein
MAFIFRRKQYDPYIPDDIENKIIELDDSEIHLNVYYNEDTLEPLNETNFSYLYENVIKGMFIMVIGSLCFCFGFISILYNIL